MSNIKYVELFGPSIQGEGHYTGRQSVFLRLVGCTLECNGFSQKNPADPSTYVEQIIFKDPKSYKTLEDLPVLSVGCDSSYSVSAKFKHLFKSDSTENVAELLIQTAGGEWLTSKLNDIHLVITGGEPMLWQDQIVEIVEHMIDSGEYPHFITIETNGTRAIKEEFRNFILFSSHEYDIEWFWSISPKLLNVSGEADAIHPDIWEGYFNASDHGAFKYVITDSEAAWKELNEIDAKLRTMIEEDQCLSLFHDVYVMPVGGTKEQQEDVNVIGKIADRAIKEGYHISGRVHATIWGNAVNT